MKNKVIKIAVSILLALVLVAIVEMALYIKLLTAQKPEAEVQPVSIEGTLNDIGELATASYGYTLVQTTTKPGKTILDVIKVPFTESKVMYSYSGDIKAGIHFDDIKVDVNEDNKVITITLPEPEILSREIFNDSLIVYDEKSSIFNQFTIEDLNMSQAELLDMAEAQALEQGLLENAEENAKNIIKGSVLGYYDLNEYELRFDSLERKQ